MHINEEQMYPLERLRKKLINQLRYHPLPGVDIRRYDSDWLVIDLQNENRLLWLGYHANQGFFITLSRDLAPTSYFKIDDELDTTANLILHHLLPVPIDPAREKILAEVERKVEIEIERLRAVLQITEVHLNDIGLSQANLSDSLLRISPNGDGLFLPQSQVENGYFFDLKLKSKFIDRLSKCFSKCFRHQEVDADETALKITIKILSDPNFKEVLCVALNSISNDLEHVYKKIVDIAVPAGAVAVTGVLPLSISGTTVSVTIIALISIFIVRVSIKLYCKATIT